MYFHKPQEKPRRWGSFQDIQYAVMKNCEKIYGIDPNNLALAMPLFWGLPPLDFSGKNNHGTNDGADYLSGQGMDFNTNLDNIETSACNKLFSTNGTILLRWTKGTPPANFYYFFTAGSDYMQISLNISLIGNLAFSINVQVQVNDSDFVASGDHSYAFTWNDSANVRKVYHNGALHTTWTDAFTSAFTSQTLNVGGRPDTAGRHAGGIIGYFDSANVILTADQIALFYDLPYGLYQPVSRPIYFFQAAEEEISIPIAQYYYNQARM